MEPQVGFFPTDAAAVGVEPRGLASGLLKHGSVAAFRAATPLPKNTQEVIDNAVVRVGRKRLVVADDLLAAGLTYSLPNWLAVPILTSHVIGEAGQAQRSMVPLARAERMQRQYGTYSVPIWCTYEMFSFGIRELLAAERMGMPLDTSHVEMAVRNVNVAIEDAVLNGGPTVDGIETPGMLSSTNTFNFKDGESWTADGHSGEDILADVQGMIDQQIEKNFYSDLRLYIPVGYGSKLNQDYKAATQGTILQRLSELKIEAGMSLTIKVAPTLPADTVMLVSMSPDVVDLVVGQTPASLSWEDPHGMGREFAVLACLVPRIKYNAVGDCGILVGTPT